MGKEGNQASSFADFAITEYRDLKRLMFWHGRDFGARYSEFINLIISKTAMTSLVRIFWNFYTGYSANNFVTDVLFALYPMNVTNYAYWNVFEQRFSFKHSLPGEEDKLPFRISEYYKHIRENELKKILHKFVFYMLSITWGSIVIFYFNFFGMAGITGEDGMDFDLWTTGTQTYIVYVLYCHSLFYINTNNYHWAMFLGLSITFIQVWLVVLGPARTDPTPFRRPKVIIIILGSLITA